MVHLLLSRELIYCYAAVTPIGLHLFVGKYSSIGQSSETLMFSARLPAGHLDYRQSRAKSFTLLRRDSHFGNK